MQTARTWTFEQATGDVLDETNTKAGSGYSGFGEGKNNPDLQHIEGVGPIPRGTYTIGEPHYSQHVGPFAMCLTPSPENEMFGRGDFLIHGDSKEHPGEASHGCIILPRALREKIWASDCHQIEVVHG